MMSAWPTSYTSSRGLAPAGSIHATRSTVRPAATATTAGTANPLLSLGEDATSGLLTFLAFVAPVGAEPGNDPRAPELTGDCKKLQVEEGNNVAFQASAQLAGASSVVPANRDA